MSFNPSPVLTQDNACSETKSALTALCLPVRDGPGERRLAVVPYGPQWTNWAQFSDILISSALAAITASLRAAAISPFSHRSFSYPKSDA